MYSTRNILIEYISVWKLLVYSIIHLLFTNKWFYSPDYYLFFFPLTRSIILWNQFYSRIKLIVEMRLIILCIYLLISDFIYSSIHAFKWAFIYASIYFLSNSFTYLYLSIFCTQKRHPTNDIAEDLDKFLYVPYRTSDHHIHSSLFLFHF